MNLEKSLNEENIFKVVSEADIFDFYFFPGFRLKYAYRSPFRFDNNPSFNIFPATKGSNVLMWKDLGTGESGNVIKFVMKLRNCSYFDALITINRDFELGLNEDDIQSYNTISGFTRVNDNIITINQYNGVFTPTRSEKRQVIKNSLAIHPIDWNSTNISYWKRLGFNAEQLLFFNIRPVAYVWLNNNIVWSWTNKNPIFSYSFIDPDTNEVCYKIYRPKEKNKRYKWLNNQGEKVIEGLEQLNGVCNVPGLIGKSLKDIAVLRLLGYYALGPRSETILLTPYFFTKVNEHFSKKLVFFDNDETGKKRTTSICKYTGYNSIFIPDQFIGCTDISDYVWTYGVDEGKRLMEKLTKGIL